MKEIFTPPITYEKILMMIGIVVAVRVVAKMVLRLVERLLRW